MYYSVWCVVCPSPVLLWSQKVRGSCPGSGEASLSVWNCSSGHSVQVMTFGATISDGAWGRYTIVQVYKCVVAVLVLWNWKYLCGSCNSDCVVAVLAMLHVDALLCHSTESNLATVVQLDNYIFQPETVVLSRICAAMLTQLRCTRTGYMLLEHLLLVWFHASTCLINSDSMIPKTRPSVDGLGGSWLMCTRSTSKLCDIYMVSAGSFDLLITLDAMF